MSRGNRSLSLVLYFVCVLRPVDALVRGVAPSEQSKYAGSSFKCLDDGFALPASAINDDVCDCRDGSDEPGTGACAGQDQTFFFCANVGSTPRQLYSSRVGDGICDCCDGSDEAALASRWPSAGCADVCAEQGIREREAAALRTISLEKAIETNRHVAKEARAEREKYEVEMAQLKEELPALEATLAKAKADADAARAQREAAEKADADAQKTENAKDVDAAPTGEAGVPLAKVNGADVDEAGADVDEAGAEETDSREEKAQVSEYTKWMEGAEETMEEAAPEKSEVSEYTKWMDGAETAMAGDEDEIEDDEAAMEADENAGEMHEDEGDRDKPKTEESLAQEAVNKNKNRHRELSKMIETFSEEHLGFASLAGKKIEKRAGEFKYTLEFFDRAQQDYTSLGTWGGWTGPVSARFTGGAMCWQGPARTLDVKFECGLEEGIGDISEPSRCVYEATVFHPGACHESELQSLNLPRVISPREEL